MGGTWRVGFGAGPRLFEQAGRDEGLGWSYVWLVGSEGVGTEEGACKVGSGGGARTGGGVRI